MVNYLQGVLLQRVIEVELVPICVMQSDRHSFQVLSLCHYLPPVDIWEIPLVQTINYHKCPQRHRNYILLVHVEGPSKIVKKNKFTLWYHGVMVHWSEGVEEPTINTWEEWTLAAWSMLLFQWSAARRWWKGVTLEHYCGNQDVIYGRQNVCVWRRRGLHHRVGECNLAQCFTWGPVCFPEDIDFL